MMSQRTKVWPTALCSHLEEQHIRLLLAAQGLSTQGSRAELEDRLSTELWQRSSGTWVWENLPKLSEARFGCSLVEWESALYLFGGFKETGQASSELLMWKAGMSEWKLLEFTGDVQAPALYHHTAVNYEGEMWVFGSIGTVRIGERETCIAAYNYHTNSWRRIHSSGQVPSCVEQSKPFDAAVCGNQLVVASQDGFHVFDFEPAVWRIVYRTPGLTTFWNSYHMTLEDRDLYLFGWSDAHVTYDRDEEELPPYDLHMYKFNLDSGIWTKVVYSGHPPSSRDRAWTVKVGDKWVLHGGMSSFISGDSLDDTYVFNFTTRVWSKLETDHCRPSMRAHYGCAKFGDHRIVYTGGRIDWNGRNRALSTPCFEVESLKLVEGGPTSRQQDFQSLLVMKDTASSVSINSLRRRLLKNTHLSDVTLAIDGEEIPAHKIVLAEGSSFFDCMWESDMLEGNNNRVEIKDVRLDVMNVILQYLYGCLHEVPLEMVVDVFRAADLYEVRGVRLQCLNLMIADIDETNLIDYWQLSEDFTIPELEHACIEWGAANAQKVVKSVRFKEYKSESPTEVKRILKQIEARIRNEYADMDVKVASPSERRQNFSANARTRVLRLSNGDINIDGSDSDTMRLEDVILGFPMNGGDSPTGV